MSMRALLNHARTNLDEVATDGGELSPRKWDRLRDRRAHTMHVPTPVAP
jgi:hypothetical protein